MCNPAVRALLASSVLAQSAEMGAKSSIKALPKAVREAVDKAVREDRATIDGIVELINDMGADASRSAVGRYVKSAKDQMERYRQAQEVAKVWVGKIEAEPEGDVGRLLSEMLRTVAFQTISGFDEVEAGATPGDVMFLAKAIKELASADKLSAERILRIRKEQATATAKAVEKAAGDMGLSAAAKEQIRSIILGGA